MERHWGGRNARTLAGLMALACAYGLLLQSQPTLTGMVKLDGLIAVLLGLYVCSHPAANMLNALFFERIPSGPPPSKESAFAWLVLNILALLVGLIVIVMGTTRFAY